MGDATQSALSGNSSKSTLQLALRIPSSEADEEWELVDGGIELPSDVQQRVKVIQQLMAARGTKRYAKVQQQAAKSLGISVRSLRRLVKAWQEQGIAGLSRQIRSDQGSVKTSQEWQDFIVRTYREGNRGSLRMTPAQVAVRVKARAQELAVEDYPGRTTIYRILRPPKSKIMVNLVPSEIATCTLALVTCFGQKGSAAALRHSHLGDKQLQDSADSNKVNQPYRASAGLMTALPQV